MLFDRTASKLLVFTAQRGLQFGQLPTLCLKSCASLSVSLTAGRPYFEPQRGQATSSHSTAYAAEIEQLRSKIFGTHVGNGLPSGRKLLRKPLIGEKIANYYIKPFSQSDPLYVDERVDR